jgi:hypothetical protein
VNLEDIPRRQEALIVAEAQQRIDRQLSPNISTVAWPLFLRSRTLHGLCGLAPFAEHL